MKKQVFLFRHGQTDWNLEKRMQGWADVPLNQKGIEQAKELSNALAPLNLDVIFSSPLSRALETAKIVAAKTRTPIIINDNLKERNVGIFQGKIVEITNNPNELQTDFSQDRLVMLAEKMKDDDFRPKNGESYNDLYKRAWQTVTNIAKTTNANKIGISTHAGVIRAILLNVIGGECENIRTPNSGYIKLNWDGENFSLDKVPDWIVLCTHKKISKMHLKIKNIDIERLPGTQFQHDVWKALLKIPYGETRTYAQVAQMSGHPNAVRAVANAIGKNPLPIIIPCHRVIHSDGTIGGYSGPGGIKTKAELLQKEKSGA